MVSEEKMLEHKKMLHDLNIYEHGEWKKKTNQNNTTNYVGFKYSMMSNKFSFEFLLKYAYVEQLYFSLLHDYTSKFSLRFSAKRDNLSCFTFFQYRRFL